MHLLHLTNYIHSMRFGKDIVSMSQQVGFMVRRDNA
jgi:hypothetical protein